MSKSLADYDYSMRDWIENEFLVPFLSIDGNYDLFWTLTPRNLKFFFRAEELKQKREHNIIDAHNWQLGLYFKLAHASNMDNKAKYFTKPKFQIEIKTNGEKKLSQAEIEKERARVKLFFENLTSYVKVKK